jgi:site-specific DNA-methyltransferase (adenine-specific)
VSKDRDSIGLSWPGKERAFAPGVARAEEGALTGGPPSSVWEAAGGRGKLLHGDNRRALAELATAHALRGAVTLAYLDPPYLTNQVHEAIVPVPGQRARDRSGPLKARPRRFAFDDRWSSRAAYLEALGQRLVLLRELLAPHGSVVVHVDSKTSHYVKVLGDEIFGEECFASEIIWRYRRWPSKTPNFQRVHDVLLRWRRCHKTRPRFNTPFEPLAASTLATWGKNKQRAVFEEDGRRARSSTTSEATQGVPMGDVWEIGVIAPVSRERTGYPTQKPEALLERLILALSDEGEVVLDPYAGSGTTLAVAARLGRTFVGVDESEVALEIASRRLALLGFPLAPAAPRAAKTTIARSA